MDLVSDFLYWHPPTGGFPDSSIRIGVEFEAGGAYEDWGYVVEKYVYVKGSVRNSPAHYTRIVIGSGHTLEQALEKARARIRADLAGSTEVKCACGNKRAMDMVKAGVKTPLCLTCFGKGFA